MRIEKFQFQDLFTEWQTISKDGIENFAGESEPAEPEPEIFSLSEEELLQRDEESFLRGMQEGLAKGRIEGDATGYGRAKSEIEYDIQAVMAVCAQISGNLNSTMQMFEESLKQSAQYASMLALGVARKMMGDVPESQAAQIQAFIGENLQSLYTTPSLRVIVAESIHKPISEKMALIARQSSYRGEIEVAIDEAMQTGDCRIEWKNGIAERDVSEIWRVIENTINAYSFKIVPSAGIQSSAPTAEIPPEPSTEVAVEAVDEVVTEVEAAENLSNYPPAHKSADEIINQNEVGVASSPLDTGLAEDETTGEEQS
jgi:flagellar assembly protein FliH